MSISTVSICLGGHIYNAIPVYISNPSSIPISWTLSYMDKTCRLELKMKKTYPVINYKIVEKPERLGDEIMSMTNRPFITLMLRLCFLD
jgi:hypothetical protein